MRSPRCSECAWSVRRVRYASEVAVILLPSKGERLEWVGCCRSAKTAIGQERTSQEREPMNKTKMRITLALLAITVTAAHADELTRKLKGDYTSTKPQKMALRTIVMGEDNEAVAAEIVIADQQCTGAISGLGKSDGRTIKIKPYMPSIPEAQSCEITISLDKSGKTATVSETKCLDYHGAQCEFQGTFIAK